MAILGEMNKISGSTYVNGSISYVPQDAWILSDTLRENILLGSELNLEWYKEAIETSALGQVFSSSIILFTENSVPSQEHIIVLTHIECLRVHIPENFIIIMLH